jgi:flagellar basal body-associated protein FliL
MSEEAKETKKAEAPADAGSGQDKSSKIVLLLTGLNLLFVLGIGGVVFVQFQKDKHKESVADIQPHAEDGAEKAEGGHGGGEHGGGEKAEGEHGGGGEHGGHGGGAVAKKGDQVITLEQFTVNLATSPGTPPRYARVIIALEVPNAETAGEVNQKMAPVRNAVIDLFNSKRPGDLQTGEGRNYLKEEIRNALNSFLVTGKVKSVFFSNFAVSN